jgi:hypothetical protein
MTPDEFLAKSRPLDIDETSRENIDILKDHIKSGKTLDPFALYDNGKEDGRHRAYAAKELGITEVPVINFRKSSKAKDSGLTPGANGHLTVGNQTDPNGGFGWAIGGKVGTGKRGMRMSNAVKSGHGLANVAQDMALATDKRTYDKDGHLHVDRANVTKAVVNPYLGHEINGVMKDTPGWRMLDPDRRYMLLRHPDELRKAVDSFNGKPILFTHKPASATDHPHDITIGATGNDASWEPPYIRNSLSIWPAYASEAIDDGSQKQLSAGYSYRADMTPGTYDGQRYDGVMRDIACNHVALVREGRAGADVAIDRALISWRGIAAAIRELRT